MIAGVSQDYLCEEIRGKFVIDDTFKTDCCRWYHCSILASLALVFPRSPHYRRLYDGSSRTHFTSGESGDRVNMVPAYYVMHRIMSGQEIIMAWHKLLTEAPTGRKQFA